MCPDSAPLSHACLDRPQIHEEEWSYIPVGGPLPLPDQVRAGQRTALCGFRRGLCRART